MDRRSFFALLLAPLSAPLLRLLPRRADRFEPGSTICCQLNTDGEWHHYAWTRRERDGRERFYVDGQETQLTGEVPAIFTAMVLGEPWLAFGGVADFRVYDIAMSRREIVRRLCSSPQAAERDLAAYWSLSEGSGAA